MRLGSRQVFGFILSDLPVTFDESVDVANASKHQLCVIDEVFPPPFTLRGTRRVLRGGQLEEVIEGVFRVVWRFACCPKSLQAVGQRLVFPTHHPHHMLGFEAA